MKECIDPVKLGRYTLTISTNLYLKDTSRFAGFHWIFITSQWFWLPGFWNSFVLSIRFIL